jgi:hypothetical protein
VLLHVNELWDSREEKNWQDSLDHYWENPTVRRNMEVEQFMQKVDRETIATLGAQQWHDFLRLYFEWKFTGSWLSAKLRLLDENSLEGLFEVKRIILAFDDLDLDNIRNCLSAVKSPKIKGLGYPGASGLLALIFKEWFGTADRFVVESLSEIESLQERQRIREIDFWLKKPRDWKESDAVLLIDIMRRKARKLNGWFHTDKWTPRSIDMILWASREGESCGA